MHAVGQQHGDAARVGGSIQIDVPVKPVWPNARGRHRWRGGARAPRPCQASPRASERPGVRSEPAPRGAPRATRGRAARRPGRAEEPGVAGHAAAAKRVAVVDLAADDAVAEARVGEAERRRSSPARSRRPSRSRPSPADRRKEPGARAGRPRDELGEEPVERRREEHLEDLAEQQEVQVAVDHGRARPALAARSRRASCDTPRPPRRGRRAETRPAGPRCGSAGIPSVIPS